MVKKQKTQKRVYIEKSYKEVYNVAKLTYFIENYKQLHLKPLKQLSEKSIEVTVGALKEMGEKLAISKEEFPYAFRKVSYYRNEDISFGRIYPDSLSYCNLNRALRQSLSDNLYLDLDIVNCHPTILAFLCQKYEIIPSEYDFLLEYNLHRNEAIEACVNLNSHYNISKDDAKTWFLKVFNGGDGADGLLPTTLMSNCVQFFPRIRTELTSKLLKDYPMLVGKENPLTFVLFDWEDKIRSKIENWCEDNKFLWRVNCYDGGMIEKQGNEVPNIELIEQYIFDTLQIKVQLKFKNMDDQLINIPDSALDMYTFEYVMAKFGESSDNYLIKKAWFEINNFFCSSEVKYYVEQQHKFLYYSKTDFVSIYEHIHIVEQDKKGNDQSIPFVKRWIVDAEKRQYHLVGIYPPGYPVPTNPKDASDINYVYSLWKGWPVEHVPRLLVDVSSGVQLLRSLTYFLWNENEDYVQYVEKYLKRILVSPGSKTQICLVLKAVRGGEGKNTWFEIQGKLFGRDYCTTLQNHERDWFGPFNEIIKEKIWIHLEEFSKDLIKKYLKQFLSYITAPTDLINVKGGHKGVYPSYANYFITFNAAGIDNLPGVQRRLFAHEVDKSQEPKSKQYYQQIYEAMQNEQVIRAYYDHIMSLDISNFNVASPPQTPYMEKLFQGNELSLTRTEMFIIDKVCKMFAENDINIYKYSGEELYQELKSICPAAYLPRQSSFYIDLKNIEGITKYMRHGSNCFEFNIDNIIKSFIQKEWRKREDFGYEDTLELGLTYKVHCPCWKACEAKNKLGSQACKWSSSVGATTVWRHHKRFYPDSKDLHFQCDCGAKYSIVQS